MTEKLTWAEFVEKYQPDHGDKFLDDRGNEWIHAKLVKTFYSREAMIGYASGNSGYILTCPLIAPKAKRKMWPSIVRYSSSGIFAISGVLHSSEQSAKDFEGDDFYSWPAIPGPDGSYEVSE